jgi:DNA-binding MarR family transcriptional regulator
VTLTRRTDVVQGSRGALVLVTSDADRAELDEARDAGEKLLRVAGVIDRLFVDAAAPDDLTPMHVRLLRAVRSAPAQHEVAAQLGCDVAQVSVLTRQLRERGLLVVVPDGGDRRVRRARLTPKGTAAVDRVGRRLVEGSPLLVSLTRDERRSLSALLDKVEASAPSAGARPRGRPRRTR